MRDDGYCYGEEFMGTWPPRDPARSFINRNDWPFLIVFASVLGEHQAIAQKKVVGKSEYMDQADRLSDVFTDMVRRALLSRLHLWVLDTYDIERVVKQTEIKFHLDPMSRKMHMDVQLPDPMRGSSVDTGLLGRRW